MNAKGINFAETFHTVPLLYPVDLDSSQQSAQTTDFVKFTDGHATILVVLGVTGATMALTVNASSDNTGTGSTDIPFACYKKETASVDVGPLTRVDVASTGITTSGNNSIFYLIEIDASEMPADKPWLGVTIADPAAATIGSVIVFFSGMRYSGQGPTKLS